ncbi:flavin reductase family protein [Candidatus Bathyarchaeota archaeon]|nr:flavin reductase family protein [Candidatus Bathyarchaeota archaeon]
MKAEIDLNESYRLLHPRPVVLICSVGSEGRVNVMACSWITPISDEPPLIAISLWLKGYTHKLIDEIGEFTVNIPSVNLLKQVWIAGTKSGGKIDKVKLLNLTFTQAKAVKPPVIESSIGVLECRVKNKIIINEQALYIAEVVKAYAEEELFRNKVWSMEANVLHHAGGRIFTTIKYIKA